MPAPPPPAPVGPAGGRLARPAGAGGGTGTPPTIGWWGQRGRCGGWRGGPSSPGGRRTMRTRRDVAVPDRPTRVPMRLSFTAPRAPTLCCAPVAPAPRELIAEALSAPIHRPAVASGNARNTAAHAAQRLGA